MAPALLCPHSRCSNQGNDTATKITASVELAVGELRKLVRDALRLSLWRATGSTSAWLVPQTVTRKRSQCGL